VRNETFVLVLSSEYQPPTDISESRVGQRVGPDTRMPISVIVGCMHIFMVVKQLVANMCNKQYAITNMYCPCHNRSMHNVEAKCTIHMVSKKSKNGMSNPYLHGRVTIDEARGLGFKSQKMQFLVTGRWVGQKCQRCRPRLRNHCCVPRGLRGTALRLIGQYGKPVK
jgi:hypothetical protein